MNELFIIIGLILLNGLFSMSETALISVKKSRLAQESKRGNRAAKAALDIANDPDCFLSTIQIGITLIGILTGLYSGATFADMFSEILVGWGVSPHYAHPVAQVSIVVVVTYLSIVVGELVPKRLALNSADTIAKLVARPMRILSKISLPAVWLLSASTNAIVKLMNLRDDDNKTTEGDVRQVIENGAASGEVQPVEKEIMNRTLMLGDQRVGSVMTPRCDVVTLAVDMTPAEIKARIAEELHDTYPVVDPDADDDVIGCISLKDLIFRLSDPTFNLRTLLTPGNFVPESMTVYTALERLKTDRAHCLLVCDEFGVMQGLITLNDILEGLVGNTDPDCEGPEILRRDDGTYLVDAQCSVYDFLSYFNIADLYEPAPYSTLAGLILEHTRQLPSEGEKIRWHNFLIEIVDMDGRRIDKLLVTYPSPTPAE